MDTLTGLLAILTRPHQDAAKPFDRMQGYWPEINATRARLAKLGLGKLDEALLISNRHHCLPWDEMTDDQAYYLATAYAAEDLADKLDGILDSLAKEEARRGGASEDEARAEAAQVAEAIGRAIKPRNTGY